MADNLSSPIANKTIDPSNSSGNTKKLLSPNAKDDPDCLTGDNPQKAWAPGGGKPKGPFGQKGKNF
jgi:hypothetical protein